MENTELTQFFPEDTETLDEEQEQKETATESSTETKPAETTAEPSPEVKKEDETPKPIPFHEDPKVQEYIERQISKRLETVSPASKETELPSWWGGDEKQYGEFLNDIARLSEEKAQAKLEEYKQEQSKQADILQQANTWFETSVNELRTAGEQVDDNTINRILKKTQEEQLIDSQGRWNYKAAYKLIKAEDALTAPKPDTAEKKKLAAASTAQDNEPQPRTYKTSEDFTGRRYPWN